MELCFFFKVDVGIVALVTTDILSQNTLAGPSIGMPNIHSLYLNDSSISASILISMNSEPNVEDSTVFCALENQTIGAQLR